MQLSFCSIFPPVAILIATSLCTQVVLLNTWHILPYLHTINPISIGPLLPLPLLSVDDIFFLSYIHLLSLGVTEQHTYFRHLSRAFRSSSITGERQRVKGKWSEVSVMVCYVCGDMCSGKFCHLIFLVSSFFLFYLSNESAV